MCPALLPVPLHSLHVVSEPSTDRALGKQENVLIILTFWGETQEINVRHHQEWERGHKGSQPVCKDGEWWAEGSLLAQRSGKASRERWHY